MTVTFCGHRQIDDVEKVRLWLENTLQELISNGADTFYLGGYGEFDELAASLLRKLKIKNNKINLVLVVPYAERTAEGYDEIIYPDMGDVSSRFAIIKRNEWMAEASDVVVAYVLRNTGGAARTLKHAQIKAKTIIRYKQ